MRGSQRTARVLQLVATLLLTAAFGTTTSGCTKAHSRPGSVAASGSASMPDAGAASSLFSDPKTFGPADAVGAYVCDAGATLRPRPLQPERHCYDWMQLAHPNQAPYPRPDAGFLRQSPATFRCPLPAELDWGASGERCGWAPVCDHVSVTAQRQTDGGALTQACCYVIEPSCGV